MEEIFSFNEIATIIDLLDFQINEHKNKLNAAAVQWISKLKNDFFAERNNGIKFIRQTGDLMNAEGVIENNIPLQKRINDAASHFGPKFSAFQQSLQNHPIITEHRESASVINESLGQLVLSVYATNYYLQYCGQPFSVSSFLQHKLKFVQPRFNLNSYASGKKQSPSDVPNPELYDTLKRWRDMLCDESNMPIYMVANQATLREIATYLPVSKKDLLQIAGFGKAKVDRYGDDIIASVESYCARHNIESNMSQKEAGPKKDRKEKIPGEKTDTKVLSFNLFKEGKSIAEIAEERKFSVGTIEGHLAWFVSNGEIDLNSLITVEKQNLIKEAAKMHGSVGYKTLIENLPPGISYNEIRLVLETEKSSSAN